MKIRQNSVDLNLLISKESENRNNVGWDESFSEYEEQLLETIINPIENYETIRYTHKPYSFILSNPEITQNDIWFYFYFLSGGTYVQNYEATGLTNKENNYLLKQSSKSFFRLEFYKTPNNEPPDRSNRKLVFAKNLSLPSGEKYFYTGNSFNDFVHVPVFVGNNYRNSENMYFFWFEDESAFNETYYTGTTFWVSVKYFNAKDGTITDFVNRCMSPTDEIVESRDLYYQFEIDKNEFSYEFFNYNGVSGNRVGYRVDPIRFYEKGGGGC